MNSCMTKSIEQIREANSKNKKRNKERSEFVRNILKKNDRAIFELEKEGVGQSEIVRIINKCEGTDITEHEVECSQEERVQTFQTVATLATILFVVFFIIFYAFSISK